MTSSLDLSVARDVVPADAVDIVARAVRFELATLEDELRRTSVETAELERSVDQSFVVEADEELALERRLRDFLDDWQRHEEDQLREMIDAAQARADSRLRLARIEAGTIIETARSEVEARFGIPTEPEPPLRLVTPPALPRPVRVAIPVAPPAPTDDPLDKPPGDVDATAAALAAAVVEAFSDAAAAEPVNAPVGESAAPGDGAAPRPDVESSWLDDALAALELEDPTEALAAAAAVAGTATDDVVDEEFERAVGHREGGGPTIAQAAPEEVYARFWKGEQDAVEARRRARDWAPIEVLLPMLAVLVVLVLVGLWIG